MVLELHRFHLGHDELVTQEVGEPCDTPVLCRLPFFLVVKVTSFFELTLGDHLEVEVDLHEAEVLRVALEIVVLLSEAEVSLLSDEKYDVAVINLDKSFLCKLCVGELIS